MPLFKFSLLHLLRIYGVLCWFFLQFEAGDEHCELVAFDILQQLEAKVPFQALNRSHKMFASLLFSQ